MSYIVFDLEWNQPQDGKPSEERALQFEIIEIGAVKLNEDLRIVSKYHQMVRPQVYKEINWRIRKMLDLKQGELSQGKTFVQAAKEFFAWCGPDPVWCTWGTQDLTELQRNMAYYQMEPLSGEPIRYMNVQKMYGVMIGNLTQSKALGTAVEELKLRTDVPFHRAYSDAYYTAKVLALIPEQIREAYPAYDVYHLPSSKKKEIHIESPEGEQLISHGYEVRDDILRDPHIMTVQCAKCGDLTVKTAVKWFTANNKIFQAAGICREHGCIGAKLRIRKNEQGMYYAEREYRYMETAELEDLKTQRHLALTKQKNSE
ncbi:MAG: exonuclease domain-containing protein [Lachnospiraceae bacterium]|nr:exonuclease domain-containing protein [Lachnospiraceae bacterium]